MMGDLRFVDVRPGDRAGRWVLTLAPHLLTVSGAVQGGVVFGAALGALESATGRRLILASGQFLRHAGPAGQLCIDVEVAVDGPRTTQARAVAHLDGDEVVTVQGALGRRPLDIEAIWVHRPDVPGPEGGRPVVLPSSGSDLGARLDVHLVAGRTPDELDGTPGPGLWIAWCRRLEAGPVTPCELAVLADLSVLGISGAVGRRLTGNSVDSTLRIAGSDESEWILLDVGLDAIHDGYAHVHARLWSEQGTLLATANQSLIVREPDATGRAVRTNRRIVGSSPTDHGAENH
jgi:acyl-CoA thioesterase